jgi:23S rRNA pseudouridine2605 synthase
VDGDPAHLGQKIDPESARVEIDGLPLPVRPGLVHYLVYKPVGVISAASDPHGRTTVVDLVPPATRVYPVGRLDADSEGLIVVTNDGDLANLLTHPRYEVPKVYVARIAGHPSRADLRALTGGIELEDGMASARDVRVRSETDTEALVELVMIEGRNREVRRMFEALGFEVTALVRTAIGPLRDPTLDAGTWRHLTIDEVRSLHGAAARA